MHCAFAHMLPHEFHNLVHLGRYAAAHGVHLYTFDSESELQKVASIDPSAKLLVRLAVDNPLSKRWVCVHCTTLLKLLMHGDCLEL